MGVLLLYTGGACPWVWVDLGRCIDIIWLGVTVMMWLKHDRKQRWMINDGKIDTVRSSTKLRKSLRFCHALR
jgi:hypothetical protein